METPSTTTSLFVRLPRAEAEKLDRAAFELRAPKQDLVAGLVARYIDPTAPKALAALSALGAERRADGRAAPRSGRRITIEAEPESLAVGRHDFRSAEAPDVLTSEGVADLLQTDVATVEALAADGGLPARRVGDGWRFARRAVLEWLARTDDPADPGG